MTANELPAQSIALGWQLQKMRLERAKEKSY